MKKDVTITAQNERIQYLMRILCSSTGRVEESYARVKTLGNCRFRLLESAYMAMQDE
jgi:hypothetical protein